MEENKGTVAGLNERGFGFIKVEGRKKDLFFHATAFDGDFKSLKKGDEVTFDGIEESEKGSQGVGVRFA